MKLSVKTRKKQLLVRVKLDGDAEINKRELESVSGSSLVGFLKPVSVKKNVLEFTGPQAVSLLQYIKNPLSEKDYFYIMQQIVEAVETLDNQKLFLNNMVLDMRYVFINQNSKELLFIYLPIVSEFRSVDVVAFMQSVTYSASFLSQDTDFIVQYMRFLREMGRFSSEKLEHYFAEHAIMPRPATIIRNIKPEGTSLLSECASTLDVTEDTSLLVEHKKDSNMIEETSLLAMPTLKSDVDEGTSLLVSQMGDFHGFQEHTAYLIRRSTNERISVGKDIFTLGKGEKDVDYIITNNNAVSRIHADILTRGQRFFVVDHSSTNKTYINGVILPEREEVELLDGSILKLANEEFEFHA